MSKKLPGVSALILIFVFLTGCASSGYQAGSAYKPSDDWSLCSAKGGLALGLPAAAFDLATGGVAFVAGALISGVACANADNGMAVMQFDLDSSALSKEQKDFLDKLARDVKSGMMVDVTGHACDLGEEAYNQALSFKRAKAVKTYLKAKGVPANQIKISGKGELSPRVANSSENNRSQNRRAEIRVIKR
ncbi:OmpA family protein [Parendozoicomonas sp. Alg238-R29]|uniref:OmpA family protein n=1 Tax=Parendozoicomonas sp. Alg238-R29 TaxID=2993446 RepID=UPI00248D3E60|nr:OmpA family protein [Parendozoicomonas sp. Alg238-R29]